MTRGTVEPPLRLITAILLLATSFGCGRSASDEEFGSGHAMVRLIADTPVLVPGGTHTLGVTFQIEPEWHLYSNCQNDTGYPISVTLELPEGFEAGEPRWPASERHISPGDILDHVYKKEVTLLIPLHIPVDAKGGEWATIRGHMEWLACREVCVPGKGDATITMLIAETGSDLWRAADREPSPDAARRFAEARRRIPVPIVGDAFTWEWSDGNLVITADQAEFLGFYPETGSVTPSHLIEDGISETGQLTLRLPDDPGESTVLSGVVEVRQDGNPRFYTLTVPLPESG